jgi:SAM-dependent methyltransferase
VTHAFDRDYWEEHWNGATRGVAAVPAHPALETELTGLTPGAALDAGSGEGAEAVWLAAHGWDVTAVDISASALLRAATRASRGAAPVAFVEADLTTWAPDRQFDLVTTFYAHPSMPQHAFYDRIARWVAPGGTLLIVGHHHGASDNGHGHPDNAVTGPDEIRALLDPAGWILQTAVVRERSVRGHGGVLHDVIVRAARVVEPG